MSRNLTPAIVGQVKAIADHILDAQYSAADLRLIAVELLDTKALAESEIRRLDGKSERGRLALRKLLTPEGAA